MNEGVFKYFWMQACEEKDISPIFLAFGDRSGNEKMKLIANAYSSISIFNFYRLCDRVQSSERVRLPGETYYGEIRRKYAGKKREGV